MLKIYKHIFFQFWLERRNFFFDMTILKRCLFTYRLTLSNARFNMSLSKKIDRELECIVRDCSTLNCNNCYLKTVLDKEHLEVGRKLK